MPLCVSITTWVAPFQLSHHRRENNAKKDCHQEKMGEKSSEQNFVIRLRTKLQRMKMMGVSLIAFARKILSLKQDFWCTLHKYNNCTNAHFHNCTNAQLHIHQHSAVNIFPQATETYQTEKIPMQIRTTLCRATRQLPLQLQLGLITEAVSLETRLQMTLQCKSW